MPTPSAPSTRTILLTLAAVVAVLATTLAACEPGGVQPPDGWEEAGEGRWVRTGFDVPPEAFRDLSTVQAIGVADTTNDVVRYAKEQLLYLYRTSPEIVDSLFDVHARPILSQNFPREGFKERVDAALEDVKKAILGDGRSTSVYRQALALPGSSPSPAVYPDSLKAAGVTGTVAVQTYVDAEKRPVAVQVVEGVHPTLDALVMRQAATSEYTSAWVLRGPQGRQGGVAIPNYVRTVIPFE